MKNLQDNINSFIGRTKKMIVQIYKYNSHTLIDTLYAIKEIWESCERIYFKDDNQQLYIFNAKSIEFHVVF